MDELQRDDDLKSRLIQSRERQLFVKLIGLCGTTMAAGLLMTRLTGASAPAPALILGDVSEAHMVEIRDHRGEVALSGEFRNSVDSVGNTEKDAALIDARSRRVIGEIEVELPAAGRADRRPELEVDVIGLPPRASFVVVIDDREVGAFTTDDRGSVDIELQEGERPPATGGR